MYSLKISTSEPIKDPETGGTETGETKEQKANEIWYTSNDENAVFPYNLTDVELLSNTYKDGKGVMTFKGDLYHIGEWMFYGCSGLTSIIIPKTVMSIRAGAFSGCINLSSIILPNGVRMAHVHFSVDSLLCSLTEEGWHR